MKSMQQHTVAEITEHIRDQEEWIRDHGGTLDGYIFNYGENGPFRGYSHRGDPATIYEADVHYLHLLIARRNKEVKNERDQDHRSRR